ASVATAKSGVRTGAVANRSPTTTSTSVLPAMASSTAVSTGDDELSTGPTTSKPARLRAAAYSAASSSCGPANAIPTATGPLAGARLLVRGSTAVSACTPASTAAALPPSA